MAAPEFTPADQRKIFSLLPTGVVAITGVTADRRPLGFVVGTFQSLSLEPALVTFSVDRSSSTWPVLRTAGRFTANILASDQLAICKALGRKGEDKFAGLPHDESPLGTPRIKGCTAWIDCEVLSEVVAGDHFVIVAAIQSMTQGRGTPLIFSEGKFGECVHLPPPGPEPVEPTPSARFVDRLVDAWARAWGRGETAAFENIAAPNYVRHSRDGAEVRLPGMLRQIEESHTAFSDFRVEVQRSVAEDDMIALDWRTVAKHTGTFMGVPPTGRDVVVSGASFLRHKDGRIVEEWVAWDPRDLLTSMRIWHLGN